MLAETSLALFPKWGKKKVFVPKQMKIQITRLKLWMQNNILKCVCVWYLHAFNMHLSFPLLNSVGTENIKQLSILNN